MHERYSNIRCETIQPLRIDGCGALTRRSCECLRDRKGMACQHFITYVRGRRYTDTRRVTAAVRCEFFPRIYDVPPTTNPHRISQSPDARKYTGFFSGCTTFGHKFSRRTHHHVMKDLQELMCHMCCLHLPTTKNDYHHRQHHIVERWHTYLEPPPPSVPLVGKKLILLQQRHKGRRHQLRGGPLADGYMCPCHGHVIASSR